MLDSDKLYQKLADELYKNRAGECWLSPQEMTDSRPGDYPHGTVDNISNEEQRIWYDPEGVWLNTYS